MIKVEMKRNKDEISKIIISGHSGYEESGKDIVCASVSSFAITTVNAILRFDQDALTYIEKDGFLEITFLKKSEIISSLTSNMIELLEELQKQYSNYLKIIK